MCSLPTGNVTFLFTDIEGSTQLWESHPDEMGRVVERHDSLLRGVIESHGGYIFKTISGAFCASYSSTLDALAAAVEGQLVLAGSFDDACPLQIKVRMALNSGTTEERDRDYFGLPVNRVARLLSTAHGGQILVSAAVHNAVTEAGRLPSQVSFRDLGEHQLKDLLEAERVSQVVHPLLPDSFPPLHSLKLFRHNLPSQVSSLIAREAEIAEVERLLAQHRLVTLTGSGGTGKTRISMQVAVNVIEGYPDGVWLVELAALTDPALVPQTVATILDVREEPGKPVLSTLLSELNTKRLLLILDNCEHLIDASAKLAASLIRSCPNVRILATSREALQISGEFTYRLPPLDIPESRRRKSSRDLADYGAVRLFLDRAQAADPGFTLNAENSDAIVQVCRRLDGIPLALELAAARVRSLPPQEIAKRLDDRFALLTGNSKASLPHQQTLRALIDWSWDLLSDSERVMLARLAVFSGGWTLEACETICPDEYETANSQPISRFDIIDLQTQLIDKSLIVTESRGPELRYRLLETVRHYAQERLSEMDDEAGMHERHMNWCLSLARKAEPHLDGPEMQDWLNRLELEHDNMRAALAFSRGENQLRLATSLYRFWYVRAHLKEGRDWLEAALRTDEKVESALRATALNRAGILAWQQGDLTAARPLIEANLAIRRAEQDNIGAAAALNNLGLVAEDELDQATARSHYEEAIRIYREMGDRAHTCMVLPNLGSLLIDQGEWDAASLTYEEFLDIAMEIKDPWCTATALHNLSEIAIHRGDWKSATDLTRRALQGLMELGDKAQVLHLLIAIARIQLAVGSPERGVALLSAARSCMAAEGIFLRPKDVREFELTTENARSLLAPESYDSSWLRGAAMDTDAAVHMALGEEANGR